MAGLYAKLWSNLLKRAFADPPRYTCYALHSTKTQILALLKRTDGAAVDELASSLGLAAMTVRQHLTALERDSLVRSQEVRRPMGRPHFRYSLTQLGHSQVAQGFDRLLALLIEAAGRLRPADLDGSPEAPRRQLFALAAESLAARHRTELEGLDGAGRAERLVEILRLHGGFAEWHDLGDGRVELRDFSCVYRNTVGGCEPCAWHETFLAGIMGEAARIETAPDTDDCAACCRYHIAPRARTGEKRGTA